MPRCLLASSLSLPRLRLPPSVCVCPAQMLPIIYTHRRTQTHTPTAHTDNCLGVCTMSPREQRTAPYHKISHRLQLQRGQRCRRRRCCRRCRQQHHRKRAQKGVACTKCERTRFMPHWQLAKGCRQGEKERGREEGGSRHWVQAYRAYLRLIGFK